MCVHFCELQKQAILIGSEDSSHLGVGEGLKGRERLWGRWLMICFLTWASSSGCALRLQEHGVCECHIFKSQGDVRETRTDVGLGDGGRSGRASLRR